MTMFRAGGTPDVTASSGVLDASQFRPGITSGGILLADISEFQPDLADAAYLRWSRAVAVRAMYGSAHDDSAWYGGARRDALHAGGVAWLGIYQYLVASEDAAAQAHALVSLVGALRPGEKLICDIEEGPPGAQALRWRQWSAVITAAYGRAADPWCYAGLDFAGTAGLTPQWLAAYQASEPSGGHHLWQFTAAYQVPGVGAACDCNVYRGSIGDLAALGWQPPATIPVPPAPAPGPVHVTPAPVPVPVSGLPVLTEGDAGPAVRTLQALCGARGNPVLVDGQFGPATLSALLAVQRRSGLNPDGIAGPLTWLALLGI
jgi:hypothetical protein